MPAISVTVSPTPNELNMPEPAAASGLQAAIPLSDLETFAQKYCAKYRVREDKFVNHLLFRCLFTHYLILAPVILVIMPNWLFAECRLLYQVSKIKTLAQLQVDIDFYQHKYVVNSMWRGPLRFRISGQKLMSIAKRLSFPAV